MANLEDKLDLDLIPENNADSNTELLKIKNKELLTDISILKRLVYMLNLELESRDTHFKDELDGFIDESKSNKSHLKPDNILRWNHEDIMMIDPLLTAFQQTKEEKDQLLSNYKRIFGDISARCKDLILENNSLRQQLQDTKQKAYSTYSDHKKLQTEFLLVKEHNELLTRQTKLFHNKLRNMETVYKASMKQCECEKQDLQEKYESTRTEFLLMKGRFITLNQVNNQNKYQNEKQNDVNFYDIITKEIKDLSVELKLHDAKDNDNLKKKICALENEKSEMNVELVKLRSERDHLKGYTSAMEMEIRKLNSRYEELEMELENARKNQEVAKKQVVKCMAFIRELIGVHNSLLGQANEADIMTNIVENL